MSNRLSFAPGEWYHCYSRGLDGRTTFESEADYRRFLQSLYLANSTESMHRSNLKVSHEKVFDEQRGEPLVSVGAYALMPNHFHLVLYEKTGTGISAFMQKLGVAYAMYFNIKNNRIGNVFVKPFRSKHIDNDGYFQHCVGYVHLNPLSLFIPKWETQCTDIVSTEKRIANYSYSSAFDFYQGIERPEKKILGEEIHSVYEKRSLAQILEDAQEYYKENIKMLS